MSKPVPALPSSLSKKGIAGLTSEVNRRLLQSHCLLECDTEYDKALEHANHALRIAVEFKRFELEPRSQLFRGNCFTFKGEWKLAYDCYVRAASVPGLYIAEGGKLVDIGKLTKECLDMTAAFEEVKHIENMARGRERITQKVPVGFRLNDGISQSQQGRDAQEINVKEHQRRAMMHARDSDGTHLLKSPPILRSVKGKHIS